MGMAVVLAPAHRVRPSAGYITDNFSGRWISHVTFPVGILSLFMTNRLVNPGPF